jgi:glycosyltransferase involved in cell wall biosynthesis
VGALRKLLWRTVDSYNLLMSRAIGEALDLERPDVVNTHSLSGLSVAVWTEARRRRIPIVHTLHDQYLLCHRSTMFRPPRNCVGRCLDCRIVTAPRKRLSRAVGSVIGVSEFILKRHRDQGYFRFQPGCVIRNTMYRNPPRLVERAAASASFRFGFLGQIIPTKGVRELLVAFRDAGLAHAELWIAGRHDSPYAGRLRGESQNDPRIRWLGHVDPESFFDELDVLVVPSTWHDTAPLVVYEAFGRGVPVIGAARGGIPELVPPECGWLFDPDAPGALAARLADSARAKDRLAVMRRACYETAERAARQPWAEEYLSAFRRTIEHAAGDAPTVSG